MCGVSLRVRWMVYYRGRHGWRTKVSSVGDIRGNASVVCQTVSWVEHYFSELFNIIQNKKKYSSFRSYTLRIYPSIFGSLTYFETVIYSEPCQICTMKHFIQNPLQLIAYLNSCCNQNLCIFRTQCIQNTVNL